VLAINNIESAGNGGFIKNLGWEDFYYTPQYEYVRPTPNEADDDGRITDPEKYSATVGNISGNIIGNIAINSEAYGGAIYNAYGQIGDISANFLGNYAKEYILESLPTIDVPVVNEEFVSDDTQSYPTHSGGAIANFNGKIGTISGDFKDNFAEGAMAVGGAIANMVQLRSRTQPVIQEWAEWEDASNIKNIVRLYDAYAERMNIEGSTFDSNYAHSTEDNAYGGAIYNDFYFEDDRSVYHEYLNDEEWLLSEGYVYMSDEELQQKIINVKADAALTLTNTNFINNHADSDGGRAFGGAIYSTGDVNIIAKDGKTSLFSGNTANGENNAIYMQASIQKTNLLDLINVDPLLPSNLNLTAVDNGVIQFDDVQIRLLTWA